MHGNESDRKQRRGVYLVLLAVHHRAGLNMTTKIHVPNRKRICGQAGWFEKMMFRAVCWSFFDRSIGRLVSWSWSNSVNICRYSVRKSLPFVWS